MVVKMLRYQIGLKHFDMLKYQIEYKKDYLR